MRFFLREVFRKMPLFPVRSVCAFMCLSLSLSLLSLLCELYLPLGDRSHTHTMTKKRESRERPSASESEYLNRVSLTAAAHGSGSRGSALLHVTARVPGGR